MPRLLMGMLLVYVLGQSIRGFAAGFELVGGVVFDAALEQAQDIWQQLTSPPLNNHRCKHIGAKQSQWSNPLAL